MTHQLNPGLRRVEGMPNLGRVDIEMPNVITDPPGRSVAVDNFMVKPCSRCVLRGDERPQLIVRIDTARGSCDFCGKCLAALASQLWTLQAHAAGTLPDRDVTCLPLDWREKLQARLQGGGLFVLTALKTFTDRDSVAAAVERYGGQVAIRNGGVGVVEIRFTTARARDEFRAEYPDKFPRETEE